MALIDVTSNLSPDPSESEEYCRRLEQGDIVYFKHVPLGIADEDIDWLLTTKTGNTSIHKNVSYRPGQDVIRGYGSRADAERLRDIMQRYSAWATDFLGGFLSPYRGKWSLDYASFRPIEESGRDLPLHKRNELLHVDAFPSRPTHGGRILRFFTNINPREGRIWEVGETFEHLAREHAGAAGLERVAKSSNTAFDQIARKSIRGLASVGLPLPDRSAYDRFMLRFHDYLKENEEYQANSPKTRLEFPPNSSWIVYTDCVPHSVLSGQFALEQTFIVPFDALADPEASPVRILERQCSASLTGT